MSKTFKSVTDNESELDVRANDCGVFIAFSRAGQIRQASTFAPSDAPALALAILEAAGWPECEPTSVTHTILSDLNRVVELQERANAEAKERAELEAEALAFYEAFTGYTHVTALDEATPIDKWLAVARKAREMRKS